MDRFNVRVELLNGANGDDYGALHQRMMASGFATAVVADDGRTYHLPPAEYVHVADDGARSVRNAAIAVVSDGLRPGLAFRIYVVQFVDWASENLQPM
ncbi:hypothetical protein PQQ51_04800 [Paraburkholderia xenovorans]|uniref:hypothetical protein n=1 Tax=Paraburkholderia xenovorans TaxID=36873 RepID=UPI0038B7C0D6